MNSILLSCLLSVTGAVQSITARAAIDWTYTITVVVAGVLIVVGMLILLIFIFKAFGAIVSATEKSAKKRKEKKNETSKAEAPVVTPAPASVAAPAPVVENGISGEVVAAISAAIAVSEGGNPVVIRSIRKKSVSGRNPWASAAVADNTRPF